MLRRTIVTLAAVAAIGVTATACDEGDGKSMRVPTSEQVAAMPTTTTTTTVPVGGDLGEGDAGAGAASAFGMTLPWAEGGAIDARFTCDGGDAAPPISWTAPPEGTAELALLMVDDTAGGYVHWAVAGLPPASGSIAEAGVSGGIDGMNSFGSLGYGGPCPPDGPPHTYRVTLYALAQQPELPPDFTGEDLVPIAEATALEISELTGTYQRAAG